MSTENPFDRAELLLGREGLERLRSAKGLIFGVGGVGSWAAEALIRSGLGHLTMVDADSIHPTNVNRQAQATMSNIGQSKTSALRARLLEISPAAEIEAIDRMYDASTQASFDLKGFDFVIDAIDTLPCKTLLLKNALAAGVPVYSSMGAALRFDPTAIRYATIAGTKGCPLAKVLRQNLKREGVDANKILCVYSEEPVATRPLRSSSAGAEAVSRSLAGRCNEGSGLALKSKANGSLAQVTAPFGFALAALAIKNLTE